MVTYDDLVSEDIADEVTAILSETVWYGGWWRVAVEG